MIDLSTWNLSIPVGSPPERLSTQPKLLSGFNDQYFQAKRGSNVQFWTPAHRHPHRKRHLPAQ